MAKRQISSALEILEQIAGGDPELRVMVAEENVSTQIASELYNLRTSRGLSQQQLAELIGTQQSAIARLEDADYEGHSLRMLRRIAVALDARVFVNLIPDENLVTPG